MIITREQLRALQDDASTASNIVLEHIEEERVIQVVSHLDADGLAAAGILGKSLKRLEGSFRIRIESWIDERVLKELTTVKAPLIIFTDLGSGYLDLLKEKLSNRYVVILDHHQPIGEAAPTFTQVNPHLHGIDGSRDLSGAGAAYLMAKTLDEKNKDLACLAAVGALGDLQDKNTQRELTGVNEKIVQEAINSGYLKVETDLLLFGRETRPIHRALARTMNPFIPGISGEEDKSLAFLIGLKITPKKDDKWRALRDLSEEEKRELFSALAYHLSSKGFSSDVALNLIGKVYTLTKEDPWTPLRDAREYSALLNATGRMEKPSLGVALCMGDRTKAFEEANTMLKEYRRTIAQYLNWLTENPSRIEELNNIYVVRGEGFIDEKVISPIASIISSNLSNVEKPLIAFATIPEEDAVKISARASSLLVNKDLNLGDILHVAAKNFSGMGGGHDVAAGAQVPIKHLESFIGYVDKLVKNQMTG